jgi:aminopeptidase N
LEVLGGIPEVVVQAALLADDSDLTHPIHHAVESQGAIEGLFDDISYSKAACVIRLLMVKIGTDAFQRSLHEFFTEFLNKCADTTDLCAVFGRVLGIDMIPFFDAWTKQCNYPIGIRSSSEELDLRIGPK